MEEEEEPVITRWEILADGSFHGILRFQGKMYDLVGQPYRCLAPPHPRLARYASYAPAVCRSDPPHMSVPHRSLIVTSALSAGVPAACPYAAVAALLMQLLSTFLVEFRFLAALDCYRLSLGSRGCHWSLVHIVIQ